MIILLHSQAGDSLGLAMRLQEEGHQVGMHIADERSQLCGTGLVYQVTDFIDACDKADLILFDSVGEGSTADLLVAEGYTVLGASKCLDVLELDRIKAVYMLQEMGLRIPETVIFEDRSFERAQDFVLGDGDRWVFKASDNIGADKTFVADDADQMAQYLDDLNDTIEKEEAKRPKFLLQRFVKGVEVSSERWYAHGRPVRAMDNCTFETKKYLAGELGQTVGCSGNVVLPHADPRLRAETVDHLDAFAALYKVTGPIDLNSIVSPEDRHAYVLEVTGRIGMYAIQAYCQMWNMPLGETFYAIAKGKEPRVRYKGACGAGVPVSIAPYPASVEDERGTKVIDDLIGDPNIWPLDVMIDSKEQLVVAGVGGVIYVVADVGPTIEQAFAGCYEWLTNARMPDRGFRVDLAEVLAKRHRELRALGYLAQSPRTSVRGAA